MTSGRTYNTYMIGIHMKKKLYKEFVTTVNMCSQGKMSEVIVGFIKEYIRQNRKTTKSRLEKFWSIALTKDKNKSKKIMKKDNYDLD